MILKNHRGAEKEFYKEIPLEKIGNVIIASEFREPTEEEVFMEIVSCTHTIFHDEAGYMYDQRICLCGKHLGFI